MLALEIVMAIPLVLIGVAFVVAMAAFTFPRFALWLEARTVPRWPRTKGWFLDPSTVRRTRERDPDEPDAFS